jgi:hypothetical protein
VLLTLAVPVALQVGTLLALVYVVFVCLGLALMRGRRADISPAVANSPWTCEIAWKPGYVRSRFQAVIVTPDDRRRRVVAESSGLRWPPQDVRNPPTREIEATLEALSYRRAGAALVTTRARPIGCSRHRCLRVRATRDRAARARRAAAAPA